MSLRKTVPAQQRIHELVAAAQLCRASSPRRALRLANEALDRAVGTADAATVVDVQERLHRIGFEVRRGVVVPASETG